MKILTNLEARKNQLDPNLVVIVAVVVIMSMKAVIRTRNLRTNIRDFNAYHTSRNNQSDPDNKWTDIYETWRGLFFKIDLNV
jgi:hypothetical protein